MSSYAIVPIPGTVPCGFHTAGDVPTQKPARPLAEGKIRSVLRANFSLRSFPSPRLLEAKLREIVSEYWVIQTDAG